MGMMGYSELKSRLMSTTAFLVATGSLIAFSSGGPQAAYPFAVGGSAALGYQWLLQQSVDSIPSKLPRRTLVKVSTYWLQLFFAARWLCSTCLISHLSSCKLGSQDARFAVFRYVQSSFLCEIYGPVVSVGVPIVMCILNQAEQLHPNLCITRVSICAGICKQKYQRSRVLALHRHYALCLFFSASFCCGAVVRRLVVMMMAKCLCGLCSVFQ